MRGDLPGRDDHPRSGALADGRQDGRGPGSPADRVCGDPGRPMGRSGDPRSALEAGPALATQDDQGRGGTARRPRRPSRAADQPGGASAGDRPDPRRDHGAARRTARGATSGREVRPESGGAAPRRRPRNRCSEGRDVSRAAVFGTGTWGTAFALVLADAGTEVAMWGRRRELCEAINRSRRNTDYLPDIELPGAVRATPDPAEAASGADLVVLAVPSQTLRENLAAWRPVLPADAVLVSLMKGIELGTAKRMSEVIAEVAGVGDERVAVLSGPNLAGEIALRQPAASVVASVDESVAQRIQQACHSAYFRPYTNTDVVGTELGGAVKNVIALAVGMAEGLGFGDNTRASVITRGLAETARLGAALGADPYTFSGLAGLGDLVATCSSPLSRNRTFGEKLGRGLSVTEIAGATRQIAEGVKSCESVLDLARRVGVDMPIVEHVTYVVAGKMTPMEMLRSLISRAAKPERHGH